MLHTHNNLCMQEEKSVCLKCLVCVHLNLNTVWASKMENLLQTSTHNIYISAGLL